ncbi:hypothetical protein JL721_6781 [Aureococcus anophagefferens]|nr:hypothetical protein JL721_6781 [Aureococcus anophagefferens]
MAAGSRSGPTCRSAAGDLSVTALRRWRFETDYDKAGSETGSSDTSEIKSYVRAFHATTPAARYGAGAVARRVRRDVATSSRSVAVSRRASTLMRNATATVRIPVRVAVVVVVGGGGGGGGGGGDDDAATTLDESAHLSCTDDDLCVASE